MPRKEGLTKKEIAFCHAYALENLSARQAYLKAYDCKESTASTAGWKLLYKPEIKEYIAELQKQAFQAACISAEKVALHLAEIAFSDKNDEVYKTQDKLKALDLLQKQLGLQRQKVEAELKEITVNIED